MLNFNYPPLEDFLPPGWKPDDCGCRMASVRAAKGKKRSSTPEPACYGKDCGVASRESLKRLHDLNGQGPDGQESR